MERSHIWLGRFPTEAALDTYFEEIFEDDDAPISQFAAGQGECFIDHDWVERSFQASTPLAELLEGHSYSEDYADGVMRAAMALGLNDINTFVMADCNEVGEPRSLHGDDYALWYLGVFQCNV